MWNLAAHLDDAWGLTDNDGVWYFLGGTDDGQRTSQVDRTIDLVVTDLAAERRADFKLSQA